jgi:hypothetical protein
MEVPKRKPHATFVSGYSRSIHTFVVYKKFEPVKPSKVIEWQQANKIKQVSNVG